MMYNQKQKYFHLSHQEFKLENLSTGLGEAYIKLICGGYRMR